MSTRPAWTLAEAAQNTDVSVSTLRRALRADRIAGAYKDHSGTWRLPIEGLIAAGYPPRSGAAQPEPETAPAAAPPEHDRIRDLEAALRIAKVERDAARELAQSHQQRADSLERALLLLEAPKAPQGRPAQGWSDDQPRVVTDHSQNSQMTTPDLSKSTEPPVTGWPREHPGSSTDHGHDQPAGVHDKPRPQSWWQRLTRGRSKDG